MATNTYRDLCPHSRCMEMVLRSLVAWEVRVPPKTVIGRIHMVENVPDGILLNHIGEDLPPSKWRELPEVSQTSSPELLEKKVTWPTHGSSQSEVPTLESDVLGRVDLSGYADWDPEDQWEVQSILRENVDVFTKDDLDLGQTSIVKHKITLEEGARPDKECYGRVQPRMHDKVWNHLQEMIDVIAIRPSNSPWVSTVVLVRKKNGKLPFCIDQQKLNSLTVKDTYSIPRIQDTLHCLQGAVWFTLLSLKCEHWQAELEEATKALTAFTIGPLRFYEWKWMLFGPTNAPAIIQHLMETCLGDLQFWWCIIYLDDVIIFARTPMEHLKRMNTVLLQLQDTGLKLQPTKYKFFKTRVICLWYEISKKSIQSDDCKVEAIKNWHIPNMVTELWSFLGFMNYYHHFFKGYAKVTCPLYDQISGDNATWKTKIVRWTEDCEEAFNALKALCTSAPILAFAHFTKPFKLHINASNMQLGAILYQEQDGINWVIGFASQSLSKSESNYPAHKLEFLALKWTVTKIFRSTCMVTPLWCTPATTLWPMYWPWPSWTLPDINGLPNLPSSISLFTITQEIPMSMQTHCPESHGIRT